MLDATANEGRYNDQLEPLGACRTSETLRRRVAVVTRAAQINTSANLERQRCDMEAFKNVPMFQLRALADWSDSIITRCCDNLMVELIWAARVQSGSCWLLVLQTMMLWHLRDSRVSSKYNSILDL